MEWIGCSYKELALKVQLSLMNHGGCLCWPHLIRMLFPWLLMHWLLLTGFQFTVLELEMRNSVTFLTLIHSTHALGSTKDAIALKSDTTRQAIVDSLRLYREEYYKEQKMFTHIRPIWYVRFIWIKYITITLFIIIIQNTNANVFKNKLASLLKMVLSY